MACAYDRNGMISGSEQSARRRVRRTSRLRSRAGHHFLCESSFGGRSAERGGANRANLRGGKLRLRSLETSRIRGSCPCERARGGRRSIQSRDLYGGGYGGSD